MKKITKQDFATEQLSASPEVIQHETINPSILYYGTPVLLLSTLNEDGSTNLSTIILVLGTGGLSGSRSRYTGQSL